MKTIKLNKIHIHRFQKLVDVEINLGGKSIEILGENGTGKTTVANSILWLLFDKNVENKKDFEVKNVNLDSNKDVTYSVECVFSIDDELLTLKRDFYEKWTITRNTRVEEMKGHVNEYFINGSVVKQKEFKQTVSTMIDEKLFKLLTDPLFFSTQLHWKDQRNMVLSVCDVITDDMVFEVNSDLMELKSKLNGVDIEQFKKNLVHSREKIKKSLDQLPGAITELKLRIERTEVDDKVDFSKYEETRDKLQIAIANEREKQSNYNELFVAYQEYKHEEQKIKNLIDSRYTVMSRDRDEEVKDIERKITRIDTDIITTEDDLVRTKRKLSTSEEEKARLSQSLSLMKKEYETEKARVFETPEVDTECYLCGGTLPQDMVDDTIQKAKEKFEKDQDIKAKGIVSKGRVDRTKYDNTLEDIKKYNEDIDEFTITIEDLKKSKYSLEVELNTIKTKEVNLDTDEVYIQYNKDLQVLQSKPVLEPTYSVDRLQLLEDKLESVKTVLLNKDIIEKDNARIKELKGFEKSGKNELLDIADDLSLCDEFYVAKVNLIEQEVARKFKLARFKMFNTLVNGELEETCVVTLDGVPFTKGLNNGGRINVGLDIINTLIEKYKVKVPIIIDNAESVTEFYDIDTQTIKLVVSDKYKNLTIGGN